MWPALRLDGKSPHGIAVVESEARRIRWEGIGAQSRINEIVIHSIERHTHISLHGRDYIGRDGMGWGWMRLDGVGWGGMERVGSDGMGRDCVGFDWIR